MKNHKAKKYTKTKTKIQKDNKFLIVPVKTLIWLLKLMPIFLFPTYGLEAPIFHITSYDFHSNHIHGFFLKHFKTKSATSSFKKVGLLFKDLFSNNFFPYSFFHASCNMMIWKTLIRLLPQISCRVLSKI